MARRASIGFPLRSIPEDGDGWSPSREKKIEASAPSEAEKLAAREALSRMDKALASKAKSKENVMPLVSTSRRGGSSSSSSSDEDQEWGDDANGQRLSSIDAAHFARTTKKGPRRRQTIASLLKITSSDKNKTKKKSIPSETVQHTQPPVVIIPPERVIKARQIKETKDEYDTVLEYSDDAASLNKEVFDKARSLHARLNKARRSLAQVERFFPADTGCGSPALDSECTVVDCIYATSCEDFDGPEEVQPSFCQMDNLCTIM